MPRLPSLAPCVRIGCESLEQRLLLSDTPLPTLVPATLPLVAGYANLQPTRLARSLEAVAQQLQDDSPRPASPDVATPASKPSTVQADLDQDGVLDTVTWWNPAGGSQEILQVVYGQVISTRRSPSRWLWNTLPNRFW